MELPVDESSLRPAWLFRLALTLMRLAPVVLLNNTPNCLFPFALRAVTMLP
jgi:hypothetical protein